MMERNTTPPGVWLEEKNQFGGIRRYRWENGAKAYETMVTVDGTTIPQSQLADYHRRRKEQMAAQIEEAGRTTSVPMSCPFNGGGHRCTAEKCVMYTGDGCILAKIAERATTETAGKSCPFSPYQCRTDCGLYKSGCILTAIQERIVKK